MYDLVTIDPGKRMGIAKFRDGVLIGTHLIRDWVDLPTPLRTKELAIEIPEIRVQGGGKGDPNDMIRLGFRAGWWVTRNVKSETAEQLVRPFAWKGNVPKEIMTQRIKDARHPEDIDPGKDHNVLDAVGLGYFLLRGHVK